MFGKVVVHPRVTERHPYLTVEDVLHAVRVHKAVRRRNFDPPCHFAIAGLDSKGRMIEILGAEQEDGTLIVYHAMKITEKMAKCVG